MKKIIIATFVLLGVISIQAQKNSILLGTDFNYNRANSFNNEKVTNIGFSPIIAYEVANNWFIGATTSLNYGETTNGDSKLKNYNTKVGGFVRYYHPFSQTFGIFGDLGAGYIQNRQNSYGTSTDPRLREYGYYLGFTPSLFVNFKNNFGLNISFGGLEYTDTKTNIYGDYSNDSYLKSKDFDVTFGKALKVGITKKFSF